MRVIANKFKSCAIDNYYLNLMSRFINRSIVCTSNFRFYRYVWFHNMRGGNEMNCVGAKL